VTTLEPLIEDCDIVIVGDCGTKNEFRLPMCPVDDVTQMV